MQYRTYAALSSVAPVLWWLGGGAARLAGLPQVVRSSNPFESPPFVWKRVVVVVAKAQSTEAAMAHITPFNFGNHAVRVITRNNQPWFVATDICEALGYSNTSKAIGDHLDADERASELVPRTPNDSLGVPTNLISESGLYALVLRSRKPEARKFAKWVTSEVLPSIRKTGSYQGQSQATRAERAHQLATKATAQVFDTVFQAALRDDFHPVLDRLLLSVAPTEDATPQAVKLDHNAIVTTIPHLIRAVASDLHISTADLTLLALACTQRLVARTPTAAQGRLQI